jgi:hypothetical protein
LARVGSDGAADAWTVNFKTVRFAGLDDEMERATFTTPNSGEVTGVVCRQSMDDQRLGQSTTDASTRPRLSSAKR